MVVVHEATQSFGPGAELLAAVQQRAFDFLKAPLARVAGFDTPFPYSLEDHYMPSAERILAACEEAIEY